MRIIATATGDDGAEHGDVMDVELTDFFEGYVVRVEVRGGHVLVREDGTTRFCQHEIPLSGHDGGVKRILQEEGRRVMRDVERGEEGHYRPLASEDGGERLLQEEGKIPWRDEEDDLLVRVSRSAASTLATMIETWPLQEPPEGAIAAEAQLREAIARHEEGRR